MPQPAIITADGLERGTRDTGRRLGQKLRATAVEGSTIILLYDSVKSGPPPVLHVGSRLLDGIYEGMAGCPVKIVGAGTLSDFALTDSFVWDGACGVKHAAVAVVFPPSFTSHTMIMPRQSVQSPIGIANPIGVGPIYPSGLTGKISQ